MSDWQAGDIALCLVTFHKSAAIYRHPTPVKGRFYTVQKVTQWKSIKGLLFRDIPSTNPYGYAAYQFVKVTPLEEDEFDKETIKLYKEKEKVS